MRLAAQLNPSVREKLDYLEVLAAQKRFAIALDDAGVREAVEKLEWILMGKTPPWIVEAATEALSALTGTAEKEARND